MSPIRRWTVALAALFAATGGLGEGKTPFVVIVNKMNKFNSLSASKLQMIFLRKVSRWPWGAEAVPIDLPDRSPARQSFTATVLQSSVEKLAVYWIDQKVTRNIGLPMQAADAAAAKALVASRPGGIAYIPAESLDDTVKAITVE